MPMSCDGGKHPTKWNKMRQNKLIFGGDFLSFRLRIRYSYQFIHKIT